MKSNKQYLKNYIPEIYLKDINHLLFPELNKIEIENYFKKYRNIGLINLCGVDLNSEKLKTVLNCIKHVNYYFLFLNYNLRSKIQFEDSDTEVIKIIGDFIKNTKAKHGDIVLPEKLGENAGKLLFPYFKESKIKKITFSKNTKLSDKTVQLYNSISERIKFINTFYNTWKKN